MSSVSAQEKFYIAYLVVSGKGRFPIDMLRYERAIPATEKETNLICRDREVRVIVLTCYNKSPIYNNDNVGRWKSFGWNVVGQFNTIELATNQALHEKIDLGLIKPDEPLLPTADISTGSYDF